MKGRAWMPLLRMETALEEKGGIFGLRPPLCGVSYQTPGIPILLFKAPLHHFDGLYVCLLFLLLLLLLSPISHREFQSSFEPLLLSPIVLIVCMFIVRRETRRLKFQSFRALIPFTFWLLESLLSLRETLYETTKSVYGEPNKIALARKTCELR